MVVIGGVGISCFKRVFLGQRVGSKCTLRAPGQAGDDGRPLIILLGQEAVFVLFVFFFGRGGGFWLCR